ncbi:MAG: hypothetical protein V4515_09120 [Chloroflexota bacterium]
MTPRFTPFRDAYLPFRDAYLPVVVLIASTGCAGTGGTVPDPERSFGTAGTPSAAAGAPILPLGSPTQTRDPRPSLDLRRTPGPAGASDQPDASILPPGVLAAIVADAAGRTGVDQAQVALVRAQLVTWPDGALGCPVPGMSYTDALVPGAWVIVEADGRELDYRASERGGFVLCERPGAGGWTPSG